MSSGAMPIAGSGRHNLGQQFAARSLHLTKIEVDILRLVERGLTNRQIALDLGMQLSTVRWRLNRLFHKLDARNRIEALARADALLTQPPNESESPLPRATFERLGSTQLAILSLLRQGMTNQEIANHLAITLGTTRWHMNQIFGKLQVRNRVEASIFMNSTRHGRT
jgi:DNA-binding NarL/FixJ family response regulator